MSAVKVKGVDSTGQLRQLVSATAGELHVKNADHTHSDGSTLASRQAQIKALLEASNANSAHISDNLDHLSSDLDGISVNLGILGNIDGELEGQSAQLAALTSAQATNLGHISDNLDHLSSNIDDVNTNLGLLGNIDGELEGQSAQLATLTTQHQTNQSHLSDNLDHLSANLDTIEATNESILAKGTISANKLTSMTSTLESVLSDTNILAEAMTSCDTDELEASLTVIDAKMGAVVSQTVNNGGSYTALVNIRDTDLPQIHNDLVTTNGNTGGAYTALVNIRDTNLPQIHTDINRVEENQTDGSQFSKAHSIPYIAKVDWATNNSLTSSGIITPKLDNKDGYKWALLFTATGHGGYTAYVEESFDNSNWCQRGANLNRNNEQHFINFLSVVSARR